MASVGLRHVDKLPPFGPRPVDMQVLCLGLSRTSTMSLWVALKKLGYNTYHFMECGQPENIRDGHLLCWKEALEAKVLGKGKPYGREEFDKVLGRYSAVTDAPNACFADELLESYPNAKVILSVRDPDKWVASMETSYYRILGWASFTALAFFDKILGTERAVFLLILRLWTNGDIYNRQKLREGFIKHNQHIRDIVPKENLFEFQVDNIEGWEPLYTIKKELTHRPLPIFLKLPSSFCEIPETQTKYDSIAMAKAPYDQPLDTVSRNIRLLEILQKPHPKDGRLQCSLTVVSLLQDPKDLQYQALSYTWGKADNSNLKIWVNGVLVPVRRNLLCALRVLRADPEADSLPIWIDALCINQQDILERGHQVDMMGVVYRGAQRVIAWLGTPDPEELESTALDVKQSHPQKVPVPDLRFIKRAVESNLSRVLDAKTGVSEWAQKYLFGSVAQEGIESVVEMCGNEYWNRLWITQEICLARTLCLFRGRESIDWEYFCHFQGAIKHFREWARHNTEQSHAPSFSLPRELESIACSRPWQLQNIMRSDINMGSALIKSSTLQSILELSKDCVCEDRRDKVYGIMGLTTDIDELDLPVDYSQSLFQLYRRAIELVNGGKYRLCSEETVAFSRILQRSLLGPDFGNSVFEEMSSGRSDLLSEQDPTSDNGCFQVQGAGCGKVVGTSTTFEGLSWLSTTDLSDDIKSSIFELEEKIWSSSASTGSDLDEEWKNFSLDLKMGIERNGDEIGLEMFVTDTGNVGLAPEGVEPGDIFWNFGSADPAMAVVRDVDGIYRFISRAVHVKDWRQASSYSSAKHESFVKKRNEFERLGFKMTHGLTVTLNLAHLQVMTCPLRESRDIGGQNVTE
ncbi:hypothetical protein IFR05_003563 [Cadophora sp. M221]|nr:hypothetical protein IFR05_003563 [Cadophora sp. M221]